MFRAGKLLWIFLPLVAILLGTAIVRSQQNLNPGQPRPFRTEDGKPYKRWEWAYRQRAYPSQEIPEHALERAEQQLQQWQRRFRQEGLEASPGRWVNLGPAPITGGQTSTDQTRPVSGRVTDVAVDPTNPNHWLIGAAQGGVWETRDAGATWTPLTDNQVSLSIGAVAFAPSNPNIIYVGTGEAPIGGGSYAGLGLLKSTDGGKTWQLLAETDFAGICFSDIKVDPQNPQIVVAALADGPTNFGATKPPSVKPVGGIFKTTNGGVTWDRKLGRNSWATDLETDPSNFSQQYAALGATAGSTNNGVYRSTNAGDTWDLLVNGPGAGLAVGRVELAIAPSDPKVLYVSIQNATNNTLLGIWRTADAWAATPTWQALNVDAIRMGEPRPQLQYDHEIIVDPTNPNTLYVGGVYLYKCANTTASPIVWERVDNKPGNALHVDQHTMAWTQTPQTPQTAATSLEKLPMSFEPNEGQAQESVQFLARGQGYNLQLTATEAVLQLRKAGRYSTRSGSDAGHQSAIRNPNSAIVKMKLVGANKSPQIIGQNALPGKSNYLIGNDPQKWRTGIPHYAAVRYDEVWPGIDLAYYGNQQQLEYDFIVAPGAHPKQIKLGFRGARRLSISRQGDLVLRTSSGKVRLLKPVIYQQHNGVRKEIRGRYVRRGNRHIGFQMAAYDHNLPLVIDPVLVYSTYLGGNSTDEGRGIAVDSSGNVYVTGFTTSTNFPTASPFQANIGVGGAFDVFVTKLNPSGSMRLYSTYLGGSNPLNDATGVDTAYRIAVDSQGHAYVTGATTSSDFPTTPGAFDRTCGSGGRCEVSDVFVTKLNPAGDGLVYSTYLGGSSGEEGRGIAVDSQGNAYVTGETGGNFPFTPGAFDSSYNGGARDCFVTKLNPTGSALVYSTYLGGSLGDRYRGIAVDADGNAYVSGNTESSNFPTTPGAFDTTCGTTGQCSPPGTSAVTDVIVTKLNAAGSALIYSSFLGGDHSEEARGIAVDASGSAYVTGGIFGGEFPTTPGAFKPTATVGTFNTEAFVTKLNPAGSGLVYSTYLGGSSGEGGNDIAVDPAGNAHVTGTTLSTDFPVLKPIQGTSGGAFDAFVTKLNATGSALIYSTYLGGAGFDDGNGIAVDTTGNAYVTGRTQSTNFLTKDPVQANSGGASDSFITKISDQTPARLIVGNDGGVWSSPDGGQTWADHNTNLSITQFYNGSLHPTNPNAALGAGQDNGTAYWTGTTPWRTVLGGDGATSAFSSANPDTHWMVSASSVSIWRTTNGGATTPTKVDGGITRNAGNTPFIPQCVKCPNDDDLFLAGTDSIWRTDDFFSSAPRLPSWTPETPSIGGNISAIAFAPGDNSCDTWAYGTNMGQLRLTRDGGLTVNNIGAANLPNRYVTDLAFHPYDANILYVSFSGFNELTTGQPGHLFKTTNALAVNPTWTNVSPPLNIPLNTVAVDPSNPEIVYVGSDMGVWKSVNGGAPGSWEHYGPDKGMPKITVYDLQINSLTDRVIAFTHGRGAFTLEPNRADLTLTKTDSPDPVAVNQNLTYTLTVKNNGPDKATEVFLRDTLPPGVMYVSSTASQGFCTGNSVAVNCQLGEINNGATVTVTIVVKPTQPGNIMNMAQVGSDEFDHALHDNKATVTTQVLAPDLAVTKTHTPNTVFAGQNFNYAITVKNNGLVDATGVVLTDTLPAGVVFVSATTSQGSCTGTTTVTCNLGGFAKGATANITLVVRAATAGTVTNTATAEASEPDANPADNRAQDTLTIGGGPAITKITPATAMPGTNDLALKIEGVNFAPGAVISFQPAAGIEVLALAPNDPGFIGPTEIQRRINLRADAPTGERQMFVTNPSGASGGERPFNLFTVTSAAAAIEVAPTSLDFASVTTGQSRDLTLTVRNTGGAILTINPAALGNPRFQVMTPAMPFTVSAGAQQSITVRFTPAGAGPQSGALTLTSNAANRPSLDIALSGAGVGTPSIAASPGTLDFGSSAIGQSANRTLTLSNSGDAALNIYAVTSSNPSFRVTLPTVPFTLPATGTAALTASFTPTSAGVQIGTLLIASNATDKTTLPVQVRGETPGEILATDDGTIETGALQDGLLIVNRLTPSQYPVALLSLRIFFAQFQGLPSPVGEQIRLVAFADPAGAGQPPANPTLLVNQMVTIPAIPANGGYIDFPVPAAPFTEAATLMIESGDIYIGYQSPRPARGVAFAADSSGPQQQRAFLSTNDGASYVKMTGVQNQQGTVTQVNVMMQASLGGLTPCSYAINPTNQVFTESGGNGTVTITAPSGCGWDTESKADWITFAPNSNGAGNGTVNLSVAAGATSRQAVVTVAGQTFTVAQAEKVASVSGASYRRSGLASDAIASAFGLSLAPTIQSAVSLPLPTLLAGTTVKVRDAAGTELFAPLFFVSPGQINFLMPPGIAPGTVLVTVNQNGVTSVGAALNDAVAPGIFAANQDGAGAPAGFAIRVKANGEQLREPLYKLDPATGKQVPAPIDLGPEGEVIILELYGTGIRGRSSQAAVSATMGGVAAGIEYAGQQPGYLGLDQVNIRMPRSLLGRGEVDLVLTVEGKSANVVRINVR